MKEARLPFYFLLTLGALFIAFTVVDNGTWGERALIDESRFYYPSIVHFFNGLGIGDYPAAIAPAYFYFMSLLSDDLFTLKVANILLNLLFLYYVIHLYKLTTTTKLWLLMPLCTSLYFISSILWLSPDNSAVFASLIALHCYYQYRQHPIKQDSVRLLVLLSLSLTLAVWTRQTSLYLLGAIFLTEVFTYKKQHKLPQLFITFALPLITLAYLFYTWRGLTPPSFAVHRAASLNVAAISHFFSLFFFYGVWFFGKHAYEYLNENRHFLIKSAAGALVFSLLFANTQSSIDAQKLTGGIVTFARFSPELFGYNLFEFFTCFLGFVLFLCCIQKIDKFDGYLIVFTSLTFFVSLTANFVIYERYYSVIIYLLILHLMYIKDIKLSYTLIPIVLFNAIVTVYKLGILQTVLS